MTWDYQRMIRLTVGDMFDASSEPLVELEKLKQQESAMLIRLLGIRETTRVLDYGAGMGFMAMDIQKVTPSVWTHNIDPECQRHCEHLGLPTWQGEQVDWVILKDVVENFTPEEFDSMLDSVDTGSVFFNYYAVGETEDNTKKQFYPDQIDKLAEKYGYKTRLHETRGSSRRVIWRPSS